MLTKKEIEVLRLKQKGLIQYEIASRLKITQPAVSNFYTNALKKLRSAKKVLQLAKDLGVKFEEEV